VQTAGGKVGRIWVLGRGNAVRKTFLGGKEFLPKGGGGICNGVKQEGTHTRGARKNAKKERGRVVPHVRNPDLGKGRKVIPGRCQSEWIRKKTGEKRLEKNTIWRE